MIVPGKRLLLWFAVIVLPASGLAGLGGRPLYAAAALIGAFVLTAAADAVLARRAIEGLSVELPETVRLIHRLPGALEVTIRRQDARERRVRLGVPFPAEIRSALDDMTVVLPAGRPSVSVSWPATAARRGRYLLRDCYVESPSPLGLWEYRGRLPASAEIRVYPDLSHERRRLASLFLTRGGLGSHARRQVGKGREFEKLREYAAGDSFDDIHWKATARHGRPVTKVFQIERTQEVYVVVDASRLSGRIVAVEAPPGERPRVAPDGADQVGADPVGAAGVDDHDQEAPESVNVLERYITAALVLALAAERQGDRYGLVAFSDKVVRFVRSARGRGHHRLCQDALFGLHPADAAPDFRDLCSFLRLRLRRRALLVFLTSLDDAWTAESLLSSLDLVKRQHLVFVAMMRPPGVRPLFSGVGAQSVDDVYADMAGHLQWRDLRETGGELRRRGIGFGLLDNETLCPRLVAEYVAIKQRQIL